MWNNGKFVTWQHISDFRYNDKRKALKLLPKITNDHMKSTSYGAMKVSLAAQVLSSSMNSMLREFGPDAATETANLCYYMDSFF